MKSSEIALFAIIAVSLVIAVVSVGYFVLLPAPEVETSLPSSMAEKPESSKEEDKTKIIDNTMDTKEESLEMVSPDGKNRMEDKTLASVWNQGKGVITGKIFSEYGGPIQNVEVELKRNRFNDILFFAADMGKTGKNYKKIKCETQKDGSFKLEGTPVLKEGVLFIKHPEYALKNVKVLNLDEGARDMGAIYLQVGGSVSGYVVDAEGAPLEGAEVSGRPSIDGIQVLTTISALNKTVTDKSGYYQLRSMPAGTSTITAKCPDYLSKKIPDVEIHKGRDTGKINFTLKYGDVISGVVLDADKKPLANAKVSAGSAGSFFIMDDREFPEFFSSSKSCKTNQKGEFIIKGLKPGEFTVRVHADSYQKDSKKKVKNGTTDLEFILKKCGWVAGRIKSANTDEGVKSFDIEVERGWRNREKIIVLKGSDALKRHPALEQAKGAYFIDGLQKGKYRMTVSAEGFADMEVEDVLVKTGAGTVKDVLLLPENTVSGTILSTNNEPLEGGKAIIKRKDSKGGDNRTYSITLDDEGEHVSFGKKNWSKSAKSNKDGKFTLRGVPKGEFEIVAEHDDYTKSDAQYVTLNKDQSKKGLVFKLSEAGAVKGKVFTPDGQPKPNATVAATIIKTGDRFPRPKEAVTNSNGEYLIKQLSPGEYKLRIKDAKSGPLGGMVFSFGDDEEEDEPGTVRVLVKAGETTEQNLFDVMRSSISGIVTEAGHPVENIKVQLYNGAAGGFNFMPLDSSVTDRSGRYSFEELKPGDYNVVIAPPAQEEDIEKNIALGEGIMAQLDIPLPSGRISGIVTDLYTGAPIPGIQINMEKVKTDAPKEEVREMAQVNLVMASEEGGGMETMMMSNAGKPVKTDENGYYEIRYVPPGEYAIKAKGKGYAKNSLSPITVAENKTTSNQNLKMAKGFTVSGQILDSSTGEKADFFASLICRRLVDGQEQKDKSERSPHFSRGSFKVTNLSPGDYRLRPMNNDYSGSLDFTVKAGDLSDLELVLTKQL